MKSLVEIVAVLMAPQQAATPPATPPPELPAGEGPRATSGEAARYDAVGYAADRAEAGVAHPTLPIDSHVEVTALDSGRTVLLAVTQQAPLAAPAIVALSPAARTALGLTQPMAAVRVRAVTPPAPDMAAARRGEAVQRLDAPPVLLTGLRKDLPPRGAMPMPDRPPATPAPRKPATDSAKPAPAAVAPKPVSAPPAVPKPMPAAAPAAPSQATNRLIDPPESIGRTPPRAGVDPDKGWFVQVATLSDAARAKALAADLGGSSVAAGRFWRVRMGPYGDRAGADAARANAAKRGYRDARAYQVK
ncbi:SPOR domain-containing protein [Sphingomonas baiyangensis]|uniref:SPOR domain-containing protein n=1 Tax=Sphingomonas baiyangensis TaxID=2572576 RepID=A0A4U1L2R8_9SPHN|nr:SPOR domain-containing protein [Sphingomonas baiyangensis]TKD50483.1 hypothetical protein FBR43_06690 [Sphingomonas baiyangensis]